VCGPALKVLQQANGITMVGFREIKERVGVPHLLAAL
jgi:hypothetical protein